jgi:hypothetical protein
LLAKFAIDDGKIFDGPQPNLPSDGFKLSGILISLIGRY